MKLGAKIFGTLAIALIFFLLLGIFLPGTWEADADGWVDASPARVFPFLAQPDLWVEWNSVPEAGLKFFGPAEGAGAGLEWDDPQYGKGRFEVLRSAPEERIEYEVLIEGGSLAILGSLTVQIEDSGTRLEWTEEGDFGWNPLLGYTAGRMGDSQALAMLASLEKLRALMESEEPGR
jgi:uncharacterized protein YndB with AHSA1/START domain